MTVFSFRLTDLKVEDLVEGLPCEGGGHGAHAGRCPDDLLRLDRKDAA